MIQEFIIVFVLFCIDTFWLEKLKILYIYPILTMIIGHALFIVRPSDKMRRKEEIHLISFQISFPFKRFLSNGKDFGIFFFIITNRNRRKFQCALNLISFFLYIYFKKLNIPGSILSEVYITSYNQLLYLSILYMSSILFDAML